MPNWCSNYLTIKGDRGKINKFLKEAKNENTAIDFNKFVPIPEILNNSTISDEEKIAECGYSSWYYFCIQEWGTKWDVEANYCDDGEIWFDSAWSPPIEFFNKLSKMYPNITFYLRYCEPGCDFSGEAKFQDGLQYDDCQEYIDFNDPPEDTLIIFSKNRINGELK